jgi:hypothetical protein
MPNDRVVRIHNKTVVGAEATEESGTVKFRDTNGELECMSYESLGIRFSFEYTTRLVFLHERDLRDCLLQTIDGQTDLSEEVASMLLSGSCSDAISVRHVGVVDGVDVGHGVFSEQSISQGTYIGEYVGLVSSVEETIPNSSHYNFQYPSLDAGLQINAREYGNVVRFINHSATPNVAFVSVKFGEIMHIVCISTAHNIPPQQQLTANYGDAFWVHKGYANVNVPKTIPLQIHRP